MGSHMHFGNYKHFYWANSVPYFSSNDYSSRNNPIQIEPQSVITTKLDSHNKPHYYLNISSDHQKSSHVKNDTQSFMREISPNNSSPAPRPSSTYYRAYPPQRFRTKRRKRRKRNRPNWTRYPGVDRSYYHCKRPSPKMDGSPTNSNSKILMNRNRYNDRLPYLYNNADGGYLNTRSGHHGTNAYANGHLNGNVNQPSWNWTLNWVRSVNGSGDAYAGRQRKAESYWRPPRTRTEFQDPGGVSNYNTRRTGGLKRTYLPTARQNEPVATNVIPNGSHSPYSPQLERLKYLNLAYSQIEGISLRIKVISTIFLICGCLMTICDIAHVMLSWSHSSSRQRLDREAEILYSLYTLLLSVLGLATVKKNTSICQVFVILTALFLAAHILMPFALPIPRRIMEITDTFTDKRDSELNVHVINENLSVLTLPNHLIDKNTSSDRNATALAMTTRSSDAKSLRVGIVTFLIIHLVLSAISLINAIFGLMFGTKLLRLI